MRKISSHQHCSFSRRFFSLSRMPKTVCRPTLPAWLSTWTPPTTARFCRSGKMPVALGGYAEVKTARFLQTDGMSEGYSFQMQRVTLFVSSSMHSKIKFLSEIEFEEGTKEINIEFASVDLRFHPLLNLRGGILMNPIGAFNQNHDGPKWEFVRPPICRHADAARHLEQCRLRAVWQIHPPRLGAGLRNVPDQWLRRPNHRQHGKQNVPSGIQKQPRPLRGKFQREALC